MAQKPVKINLDWCKACGICIEVCPKKVIEWSEEIGKHGVRMPELKRPSRCTKCMLCEMMCPDFAINVEGSRKKKAESAPEPKPAKKKKPAPKITKAKSKPKKKPKAKQLKKAKKKTKSGKKAKKKSKPVKGRKKRKR
ncbi:MAG: 4Fe-4S dicluster domain-containing protein [Planctomycetota bacterium]|jgi:2-oxoglutarate ferredoxin oxidoreductase subunit delta